jgi:hypothetical protein
VAFIKTCRENPNLVKIGQIYQELYMKNVHVFDGGMCSAKINTTCCCVSMVTLHIFFIMSATYASRRYEGNVILLFHGNDGDVKAPLCHYTQTLPKLFFFRSVASIVECLVNDALEMICKEMVAV